MCPASLASDCSSVADCAPGWKSAEEEVLSLSAAPSCPPSPLCCLTQTYRQACSPSPLPFDCCPAFDPAVSRPSTTGPQSSEGLVGHCLVPEGLEGHYLVPEIPFSVPVDCSGPVELVAAAAELEAASHLNLGSGSLTSETQLSPLSATSRSVRLCFGAVWVHGAFHTGRSYAIMGLPCLGWVPQEEGPAYLEEQHAADRTTACGCCGQKGPRWTKLCPPPLVAFSTKSVRPTCKRCSVAVMGETGKSRQEMARLADPGPIKMCRPDLWCTWDHRRG